MPAIVAIPQVVEELLLQFGDLFPNEPSRRHFAEYVIACCLAYVWVVYLGVVRCEMIG